MLCFLRHARRVLRASREIHEPRYRPRSETTQSETLGAKRFWEDRKEVDEDQSLRR